MKYLFVTVLFSLLLSNVTAQEEEVKSTCYVYRTYEDLLSGNNKLKRDYNLYNDPFDMDVFSYKVEGSKKGKKFKIKDSSYVGYEIYYNDKILTTKRIFHQKLGRFTQLLGGNQKAFMIGSGRAATVSYALDGYVMSVRGDEFFSWYFAKMEGDKQVYYNKILDIISDDPELLKLYDAEYVKVNNVRKARENDFRSDVKYLKLYLEKHK